ncbi:MAG: hypothetical protein M5U09_18875 [Gammaproteobacteria bacterium]|nr:hypothetical protein [Gammaproteobacteria bacterium]
MSIGGDGLADAHLDDVVVDVGSIDVHVGGVLGFLSNWLIDFFEDDFATMVEDMAYELLGPPVEEAIEARSTRSPSTCRSRCPRCCPAWSIPS